MRSYNSSMPSSAGRSRGQSRGSSSDSSSFVESSRARIHSLQSQQAALQQQHQQQWASYTQQQSQPYQPPPPQLLHAQQAWRASPSPPSTQYSFSESANNHANHFQATQQPQQSQPQFQPRPPSSSNQLAANKKPSTSSGSSQLAAAAGPGGVSRPTRSASAAASHHQSSSSSSSASIPPSTAAILSAASLRTSSRKDDHAADSPVRSSETPTPSPSISSPFSPSSTSQLNNSSSNNPHSLKEKVALALADLENIKSKNYRPNTAAPGGATSRDSALPRPHVGKASSHHIVSAAADSRAAEELRTAKSILRKLYKKNVQLSQDIKRLRERKEALGSSGANHAQSSSNAPSVNDSLNLDEQEQTLLHARNPDSDNDDDEDGEEQEQADENDDNDENADEDDMVSPPKSRRGHHHSRSKSKKVEKGGASHLLFLLGERDTTINRLQGQVQALTRRLNATNAKLEIATGSKDAGSAVIANSSTAASEEKDGLFNESEMEVYKKQMETFRQSLSQQLRSQLIQLNLTPQELAPNGRAAAYIRDLEQWLLWEASWRHVEKVALNAQLIRSEKQSQDSWVSTRLKEKEVADLQNNMHALDAKVRMIDTQLAATLEQKKGLEQENLRLKKAIENRK